MPQLRTKHWLRIGCLVFVWLLWAAPTLGATRTWSGAGGNNNWSTAGNWGGAAPVAGDDLVFPTGAARLSNTNNIVAGTSFNSITISGSGYTLAGNSIVLAAGNLSDTNPAGSNTISLAISMAATRTFSISNAAETLTISGVISGAGGLTKTGSGTLTLSGASTYTGLTTISAGVLKLGAAGGATNTPLGTTGAGTTVSATGAALDLNGFTLGTTEALTLNGTGVASGGALTNSSATAATYSGLITLGSASSIVAGSGNIIISNAGTITGSGFGLTLNGTSAGSSIASIIGTTSGTLTKNGTGTWTLSGANTYTGVTTVNAGTLKAGVVSVANVSGAFGNNSAVTMANVASAILNITGFNTQIGSLTGGGATGGNVTLGAAMLTVGGDSTSPAAYAGVISGTGALTKIGSGKLTLSGSNTYTGATTISQGTISASSIVVSGGVSNLGNASSAVILGDSSNTGTLSYTGAAATYTRGFTLNAGGGELDNIGSGLLTVGTGGVSDSGTFTVGGSTDVSISSLISGSGALTKTGANTLTLSNSSNSYTGITTISAGTVSISTGTNLGTAPGSPVANSVTINGGTLATTGTFTFTTNRGITLGASGGTIDVAPATTLTAPQIITGSGSLTKSGAGTLVLSNPSNSYTDITTINAGTVSISTGTNLGAAPGSPVANSVTINGGTLATTGTFTFATNRGITLGASGGTIDVAPATTLTAPQIITGSGSLTKTNAGTLVLSNSSNSYTGITTISAGTVSISTGTNLGAAPGSPVANQVTINGGTLATTGTFTFAANRGFTLGGSGGTIDVASATTVTAAQIITGSGSLTKTNAGTLTLSGDNTYTGTTTVSAGTLLVNGSQSSSAVSLNGGTLGGAGTMGAITSTASGGSLAPGSGGPGLLNSGNVNLSTGSPSFVVELNGTTAGSGYDQLNVTGTVNLTGASLSGTVGFTPAIGSTFTIINNDSTDAVTGTFAGLSEGSNVVLSGYNFTISYTGGTGNDVVLTRAATTFTWDGGGGDNNWTTAANWVGDVAPTVGDSLVFDATGVGTRPSPNSDFANGTSFGSITVSMGGYTLGGNSVSLTTGLTVSNASGSSTVSQVMGGAGTVTKTDGGTLTLSAANTYTGATDINGGVVSIAADNNLGTAPGSPTVGQLTFGGGTLATTASFTLSTNRGISFSSTGTIDVASSTTLTYGGIGAGSGGLTKTSDGTLTLSGANTYTGTTTISAGVVNIQNATALGTTAAGTTVASGARLEVRGDITVGAEALTINGTGGGSGALLNVSGSNSWAGAITLGSASTIGSTAGTLTGTGGITNGGFLLTVAGAGNTTLSATAISGTGGLTKTDGGTLTLSAANTYTGATDINGGVVSIAADNNLGTAPGSPTVGQLTFGGGTLQTTATFTLSSNRGIAFNSTGTIDVASSTTLTYGGIGAGSGGLTKTSDGTLTLSGANTYTGTTTVSAGTLLVNGSQSGSAVSVNGGTLGGTVTVGTITSTASGGTISVGSPASNPGILNSGNVNWSSGSPTFVVQLNGTTAGSGYDQLNVTGTVNLTGATLSASLGFTPAGGTQLTIINNDGTDAVVGTFSGLAEGATVTLNGINFTISYVGGTGNDVVLTTGTPSVGLVKSVDPSGSQPPETDLAYTVTFTNSGSLAAQSLVITDPIPANTDFKVGSVTSSLGTTALTVAITYSNDGGTTWMYTPVSGGGGAPAGYDRSVTNILWTFTGNLSQTSPNNTGSVSFIARIR